MIEGPRIPGLDLMIDGPIPMIRRGGSSELSSTVLIRGGPGVGKSILAMRLASAFADELKANIAYACLELLPSELAAQQARLVGEDVDPIPIVARAEWRDVGDSSGAVVFADAVDLGDEEAYATQQRFEERVVELVVAAEAASRRPVRVS